MCTTPDPLVRQLFFEALDVPVDKREAFVRERCGNARDVCREVLALLHERDQAEKEDAFAPPPNVNPFPVPDEPSSALTQNQDIPDQINNYRIIRTLGRGGMGLVFTHILRNTRHFGLRR